MRGATTVSFAVLPLLAGAQQTPPRERDDVRRPADRKRDATWRNVKFPV